MRLASTRRLIRSRLIVYWALFGAVSAGLINGLLLLPALLQLSVAAARAGVIAMTVGAVSGAVAAVLYQVVGRVRFWGVVLAVSVAFLIRAGVSGSPALVDAPLVWAGLAASSALSAWVLLAYGLHVVRRRRP